MKLTLSPFRYPVQPVALNATHASAVTRPEEHRQQRTATPPLPVSPKQNVSVDPEYRTRYIQRHNFTDEQLSSHSQQAIRTYNSITEFEDRARVSELFGLNEYA